MTGSSGVHRARRCTGSAPRTAPPCSGAARPLRPPSPAGRRPRRRGGPRRRRVAVAAASPGCRPAPHPASGRVRALGAPRTPDGGGASSAAQRDRAPLAGDMGGRCTHRRALDGVSALGAAGMTMYADEPRARVGAPERPGGQGSGRSRPPDPAPSTRRGRAGRYAADLSSRRCGPSGALGVVRRAGGAAPLPAGATAAGHSDRPPTDAACGGRPEPPRAGRGRRRRPGRRRPLIGRAGLRREMSAPRTTATITSGGAPWRPWPGLPRRGVGGIPGRRGDRRFRTPGRTRRDPRQPARRTTWRSAATWSCASTWSACASPVTPSSTRWRRLCAERDGARPPWSRGVGDAASWVTRNHPHRRSKRRRVRG